MSYTSETENWGEGVGGTEGKRKKTIRLPEVKKNDNQEVKKDVTISWVIICNFKEGQINQSINQCEMNEICKTHIGKTTKSKTVTGTRETMNVQDYSK